MSCAAVGRVGIFPQKCFLVRHRSGGARTVFIRNAFWAGLAHGRAVGRYLAIMVIFEPATLKGKSNYLRVSFVAFLLGTFTRNTTVNSLPEGFNDIHDILKSSYI